MEIRKKFTNKIFLRTVLQFLLFIAFITSSYSQSVIDSSVVKPRRPKIGLVLSGGGAKGLAHVGVLKVLEEAALYPITLPEPAWAALLVVLYAMVTRPMSFITWLPKPIGEIAVERNRPECYCY
jgi:hypothetical protein